MASELSQGLSWGLAIVVSLEALCSKILLVVLCHNILVACLSSAGGPTLEGGGEPTLALLVRPPEPSPLFQSLPRPLTICLPRVMLFLV
jgi:hypothetical protein